MMQSPQQGGASVQARGRIPSSDLATLVSQLVDAYPRNDSKGAKHPNAWAALVLDKRESRLKLDTIGVVYRLMYSEKLDAFKHSPTSGFLRDVLLPPPGATSKMGGHIFDENIGGVSKAVAALKALVTADLDRLGVNASDFLVANPEAAMERLAEVTRAKDFTAEMPANLVRMEFAKSDRPVSDRERDVARLFSAEERIQADDWLERLAGTIVAVQTSRDDEFDDIQRDKLFASLRQDAEKPDSQITRFLNFLEDEALARVRLAVTFAIMRGLAAQVTTSQKPAERAFDEYVTRATKLFDLYGAPESETALHVNLSRDYGTAADFSVSEELVKALFFRCLPVWAEANVQLFEARAIDPVSRGQSAIRDVSYRFRVNGIDPRTKGSPHSFDARIGRLRETLLPTDEEAARGYRVRRAIAETMYLWLVLNPNLAAENLAVEAETLCGQLEHGGRTCIAKLLDELDQWSKRVVDIQQTLVSLLRSRSRNVLAHAQRSVDDLYVVVQQSVVDWVAIERSRGKPREPLVKGGDSLSENIEWFRHIKIARSPDAVVDPLFSVRIQTTLRERTLAVSMEDGTAIQAIRELPAGMLNVTWHPVRTIRNELGEWGRATRMGSSHDIAAWRMGPGIDIGYDPERFKWREDAKGAVEDRRQRRAVAISAATILAYVVLQVLVERLNKERGERFPTLMVRFQTQGKEAADTEGDHLIYAASQAVEAALMRDTAVRMQGLVTTGNLFYKEQGASYALASAFPLVLGTGHQPAAEKVAVVVYATRPCDDHPGIDDADGFIFQAKTYLADAVTSPFPGYRMRFDRMQSYVVESRDSFASPKLVVEEVSRLHELGYEHVMLISNHYGNRRINRAAQRHSPHTQTGFLDEIATKFANVSAYMLRRDVFPATRLRKRERQESAFEAVRLADHYDFQMVSDDNKVIKALVPAYTFATLSIVGNDEAARPQSGFCTYFLDKDYQVRNTEWQVRVENNLLGNSPVRDSLIAVLRGLHFLEAEKQPVGGLFNPVLDPFSWVQPASAGAAGEVEAFPGSRRKGNVILSLPALLSHVTDALHRGRG